MTETFLIYRCPDCGTIMEGWRVEPQYCAGNQWGMETPLKPEQGDHPSAEMERLTVRTVEAAYLERSADPGGTIIE